MKIKLKVGETIDRLAMVSRLLTIVFGTKDKTVLNRVADGLERAKRVKDFLDR